MMFTDDPAMDAERYDEEMDAVQRQQEAAAPECCICHRKILDGTAYDFGEGIFAHGKCVDKEFTKINPELAEAAKDALWEARKTSIYDPVRCRYVFDNAHF